MRVPAEVRTTTKTTTRTQVNYPFRREEGAAAPRTGSGCCSSCLASEVIVDSVSPSSPSSSSAASASAGAGWCYCGYRRADDSARPDPRDTREGASLERPTVVRTGGQPPDRVIYYRYSIDDRNESTFPCPHATKAVQIFPPPAKDCAGAIKDETTSATSIQDSTSS